jgi:hypothetical protein
MFHCDVHLYLHFSKNEMIKIGKTLCNRKTNTVFTLQLKIPRIGFLLVTSSRSPCVPQFVNCCFYENKNELWQFQGRRWFSRPGNSCNFLRKMDRPLHMLMIRMFVVLRLVPTRPWSEETMRAVLAWSVGAKNVLGRNCWFFVLESVWGCVPCLSAIISLARARLVWEDRRVT